MSREDLLQHTRQKAFELNQNPLIYGAIAEIGAGQEVARQFFQAGGASGTIAKSVSAYDMQMSDAIYGIEQSGRYVTLTRLCNMLDTEYAEVIKRVEQNRSVDSRYFAFADTVAAKAYQSKRECHGWMGIRFQHQPGAAPSQLVFHVRMLDKSNRDQQEALGILGVNLIYAVFTNHEHPEMIVDSLKDDLIWGRIEVDYIDFSGPAFETVDNRKMNLRLVTSSLGPVVVFSPSAEAVLPADLIFRKYVLVLRGTFRPFATTHKNMMHCGQETYAADLSTSTKNIVSLCEMNVARYLSSGLDETSDLEDRVVDLAHRGYHVMVSSHFRYFRIVEYFAAHDKRNVGFILSVDNIRSIFNADYYDGMEGGILEAMGVLFKSGSKLLVYPNLTADQGLVTLNEVAVPDSQKFLYRHLIHNHRILPLRPREEDLVLFGSDTGPA